MIWTLYRWAASLLAGLAQTSPVVRTGAVVKCIVHEFSRKPHAKILGGVCTAGIAILALMVGMLMSTLLLDVGAALMAITAVVVPEHIKKRQTELDAAVADLEKIQKEHEGKQMPQNVGEQFDAKAKEAKALQDEIDREMTRLDTVRELKAAAKRVPNPALPDEGRRERKNDDHEPVETGPVAGYMTLGEYVTSSAGFREAAAKGFPKGVAAVVEVEAIIAKSRNAVRGPNGEPLVPLTHEERKERQALIESKAEPTLGTGVIEPTRIGRLAQVTADEAFTLRDVLDVSPTSSDAVKYLREESFTNAAAPTAQGSTKPESAVEHSAQTADIEVIAHWMPVHNQQLADLPALRSLIDGRLRYGLRRVEENQILYGTGTSPQLQGLLDVAGTTDISGLARYSSSTSTYIDAIRMGITEVRRAGYDPNAVVIDPIDWEEIELEKGSDNRYVWAVIRDTLGARIWSLRVVETTAAEARAGDGTEARNLLVGDFRNGATLYDRMAATVMAGWINAQFVQNKQTLLAEERVGLAIFAPAAFAKLETVAAAS